MMQLLSCGEDTILHEFPTLTTVETVHHTNNNNNDFHFFGDERLFLHYNQSDFKLYKLKENEIKLAKKYRLNKSGLTCFACPKISDYTFATGTDTGKINLYNCLAPQMDIEKSFSSGSSSIKVNHLDYSLCHKYLSSVHDDGRIIIYGLQTNVKLNELPVDQQNLPMVSRFLTSSNIKLAIGSYTGKIAVHDLVAKKLIFESTVAHKDLCCDIYCPSIQPNFMLSAGCDSIINLYDMRKKKRTARIEQLSPISTITMSACGTYIAAGDKAGEITCYDLRDLKVPLITKLIAACPISRVAFVPLRNANKTKCLTNSSEICSDIFTESVETSGEDHEIVENPENHDSFFDFGHANPRISECFSETQFSFRMVKGNSDLDLTASCMMNDQHHRDILTDISNQPQDPNSSYVTQRRKKNMRKSLAGPTLAANVIREEPEMENLNDFKTPKLPTAVKTVEQQGAGLPVTAMPTSADLNAVDRKLNVLGDSMVDLKKDLDELYLSVPDLHINLMSLTGIVMRTCSKAKRELYQDGGYMETKLMLADYLAHGERFQADYAQMVEEKKKETLRIDKILHPKMFNN